MPQRASEAILFHEVKKILKNRPEHVRDGEKEVLNYNKALEYLDKKLKNKKATMSLVLILGIHKLTMEGLLPRYDVGAWRKRAVVVQDPRLGKIIYMAPEAKDVSDLMGRLTLLSFLGYFINKWF